MKNETYRFKSDQQLKTLLYLMEKYVILKQFKAITLEINECTSKLIRYDFINYYLTYIYIIGRF